MIANVPSGPARHLKGRSDCCYICFIALGEDPVQFGREIIARVRWPSPLLSINNLLATDGYR